MSKSLGNLTLVRNLIKNYSADAIRTVLLNHHYRYPWECFPQDLEGAAETVELFQQVRTIVGKQPQGGDELLLDRFKAAMDNDLNTPQALLLLRQAAETVIAKHDEHMGTGAEVLKLTAVLGLCV